MPQKNPDSSKSDSQIIPSNSKEIWKDIPSVPGYQASSLGRIRSVRIRVLKGRRNRKTLGGETYYVHNIGNRRLLAHRMVAEAFIGPIPTKMVIHHKDHNMLNNAPSNLEIVTYSQNTQRAYEAGRIIHTSKLTPFQQWKIVDLYKSGEFLTRDLAEMFKVDRTTIHTLLKRVGCPLHFCAKLPPKTREEIRSRYVPKKISMRELAKEYGVSEGTIECIIRRKPSGRRVYVPKTRPRVNAGIDRFFELVAQHTHEQKPFPNHPLELEGESTE